MMSKQTLFDRRVLVAAGLAAGLGLSQAAMADTATDDLVVTAGLAEALTLSCDEALSFGITRVGNLEREGTTTLTVAPADGAITVTGEADQITAGPGRQGQCTIAGSNADEGTGVDVSIGDTAANLTSNASVNLTGNATAFSGLDAPTTDVTGLSVTDFTLERAVEIDADGGAVFDIGGELTIPATLVSDNLGGYQGTIEVKVDDGFGGE